MFYTSDRTFSKKKIKRGINDFKKKALIERMFLEVFYECFFLHFRPFLTKINFRYYQIVFLENYKYKQYSVFRMTKCINCKKKLSVGYICIHCSTSQFNCDCYHNRDLDLNIVEKCLLCNHYICPTCNKCSTDCSITVYSPMVFKQPNYNELREFARLIASKSLKNKKICIHHAVPRSYVKNNGKVVALHHKAHGFRARDEEDFKEFNSNIEKIYNLETGTEFIAEDVRYDGTFGSDSHLNIRLCTCLGFLTSKIKIKNKKCVSCNSIVDGENKTTCDKSNCNGRLVANELYFVNIRLPKEGHKMCEYCNAKRLITYKF